MQPDPRQWPGGLGSLRWFEELGGLKEVGFGVLWLGRCDQIVYLGE